MFNYVYNIWVDTPTVLLIGSGDIIVLVIDVYI